MDRSWIVCKVKKNDHLEITFSSFGDPSCHAKFTRKQLCFFECWCKLQDLRDLNDLKSLILLEQFERCVPQRIATHLNERRDCHGWRVYTHTLNNIPYILFNSH